jgi:LmbE family N-acetylglucosaminyl deacetylase
LSITNESARYIYLSPHYDDAAFSLGGWIGGRPGGLLVNIFTRSEYTASKVSSGVDAVSELRAREDKVFAERLQLEAMALGLKEPSLLGRKSRDVSGVEQDAGHLRQALTALLDERVVEQTVIFCPAGIGGHVNHLATRLVAWEWATARGAERQLRFYEDLPYASSWRYRRRGLVDLRAATAGWQLRRYAWPVDRSKDELVRLYPSQLHPKWTNRRFSPIAMWPIGRHEAAWEPIARS